MVWTQRDEKCLTTWVFRKRDLKSAAVWWRRIDVDTRYNQYHLRRYAASMRSVTYVCPQWCRSTHLRDIPSSEDLVGFHWDNAPYSVILGGTNRDQYQISSFEDPWKGRQPRGLRVYILPPSPMFHDSSFSRRREKLGRVIALNETWYWPWLDG